MLKLGLEEAQAAKQRAKVIALHLILIESLGVDMVQGIHGKELNSDQEGSCSRVAM